jgi:hypothetical protein
MTAIAIVTIPTSRTNRCGESRWRLLLRATATATGAAVVCPDPWRIGSSSKSSIVDRRADGGWADSGGNMSTVEAS